MATGYASGSSTRNGEYESAGAAAAPMAAKIAYGRDTTMRARKYAGKIVAVITAAPSSLIRAYDVCTSLNHQAGAARYASSETLVAGWPMRARRVASPVWAIERETCVNSISSLNSVGVSRRQACHAYSAPRTRYAPTSGHSERRRDTVATGFGSGALTRPRSRRAAGG